jgi:hypothetical protein
MRSIWVSAFVAWCCYAQTAGFGGLAVNASNGQPMSGVHIRLFQPQFGGGIPQAYGAISGTGGRFSIGGLPAGTYVFLAERAGFVQMMTSRGAMPMPSVTLRAGEAVTDYRLEMTPRAVIAGRVIDEYGDPLPNVHVQAGPVNASDRVAASEDVGSMSANTNGRGEFRISGGPGKFRLKATPSSTEAGYGQVWFPSALSEDRASVVEAAAGADVAIEIRMVRQPVTKIVGTVSGIPQGVGARVAIGTADGKEHTIAGVGADGRFSIAGLRPTTYRLTVYAGDLQSAPVTVNAEGPDTVEVQLALVAGVEVGGTVEVEGEAADRPKVKRKVTLGPSSAATETDGSFRIAGIYPGRYSVTVQPLPESGYVKSVQVDGAVTPGSEIELARVGPGSRMKIIVGRDGAQISGTVLNKDGQPLGNVMALVILAADREHVMLPTTGNRVNEGGKYSIEGIKPGKYVLFAFDAFHSWPVNGLESLKELAAAAEEIELKPGEKLAKDLKVITKEDMDARSKK